MIVVDTNVLVALVDRHDALRSRAAADSVHISRLALAVTDHVLTEAHHFLRTRAHREYLQSLLRQMKIMPLVTDPELVWPAAFEWLDRYAEHDPDWADACLVAHSTLDPQLRIWTYDSEFDTIWRRLDGTRVPLAVRL